MTEKSFALLFFIKLQGTEPLKFVYLRITVDGHPVEMSTRMKWDVTRWDKQKGRAIGVREDARTLNSFLDEISLKVQKARKVLMADDAPVTAEILRDMMLGKNTRKMIMEIFAQHNENMAALVPTDYAEGTLERYQISYQHTKDFLMWQYKLEDIDICKLDQHFIQQYAFWLKTADKCNHNTTMKYLANFKKIVLIAVRSGWLPGDPFANFKMTKKTVIKQPLTEPELERIMKKDYGRDRVNQVRDIFMFCCFTGLAYADVKN